MPIQRAIMKGIIADTVETRTMFTAEVTITPGDEPEDYWTVYVLSVMNPILEFTCNIWQGYQIEIQQYVLGSWVPQDTLAFSSAGVVSGESLPNAVAAVLLGKAPGLRHVGRKFFSCVAESFASGNSLTGTAITNAAAALLAYITPLESVMGTTLVPGVLDADGTFHAFTGGVVSSLLGSMRRRKPGLGI